MYLKPRNTKNEKAPVQMIAKSIIGTARTITQSECFKIAHAVTKAIIATGDSYTVTFGASVKLVRETHKVLSKTEIKGKRSAERLVRAKLGFENCFGDVMLKPPVPEKFIEVSDARGCVTRYGFDGYYGALAVRFLTSECRISMRQDRLEEFSKLSFYDEIKALLDEHIESVGALIY